MASFLIRRILIVIPMLFIISMICFAVTELQPGDFVSQYLSNPRISPEQIEYIKERLGLEKSAVERYFRWIWGVVTAGDFGYSFAFKRPVAGLIWERMGWTVVVACSSILFQWILAIPLGIYSAMHPYSKRDYSLTFLAFIGISIPDFFLALLLMFVLVLMGVSSVGGLFSNEFIGASWSLAKVWDLLKHIWLPVIVVGLPGIGGLMRVMRGNVLDILTTPFVTALRARGIPEQRVKRHVLKNALNPMVSIAGMQLPTMFSGTIIAAIILNLPTMGPFFYKALLNHDQYLVMTFLMFIAFMTQIGNILADIALAFLDPRIRIS